MNGIGFGSFTAPPFEVLLTVPYGAGSLEFAATATDSVPNLGQAPPLTVSVVADPRTTVEGVVVDGQGNPVADADVALELHGLLGEYFDFDEPLADIPILTGLSPDATQLESAANYRNPGGALSGDTFGVGFAPDFAARLSGLVKIPTTGSYTFTLGVDDGARLTIDGTTVVEVAGSGAFTEGSGTVSLVSGALPIEIEYYQAVGDAELQLSSAGPGQPAGSVVAPSALLQSPGRFTAVTDAAGSFSITGVPAILGDIRAAATATVAEDELTGRSAPSAPAAGGVTDLGVITLGEFSGRIFVSSFSPAVIYEVDPATFEVTVFADSSGGLAGTSAMAFTPSGTGLLASNYYTSTVIEFDADGNGTVFLDASDGVNRPFGENGLLFDGTGDLYVSNYDARQIVRFPADGGPGTVFADASDGIRRPDGLGFDADGNLLVANRGGSNVLQIDPGGDAVVFDSLATVSCDAFSIVVRSNRDVYVACSSGDVYRYPGGDPAARTRLGRYGTGGNVGLQLSADESVLYLTTSSGGELLAVDPDSGDATELLSRGSLGVAIAIAVFR